MAPVRRKLVWVERTNFQGWACTECAWVFNASWPLVGTTIDEMKTKFEEERDKEFASHLCADHPRAAEDLH
jgi:hypothetical protein